MVFHFVNYEGPSLPEDPGVRTMIRRQAMHDVAIDRRARGNYGQANQRQVPVFVDEGWASPSAPRKDTAETSPRRKHRPRQKTNTTAKRPPRPRPSALSARSGQYNMAFPVFCYSAASPTSGTSYGLPTSISFPDSAAIEKFTLLLNLVPLTGLRLGIGKLSSFQLGLARARPPHRSPSSPSLMPLDLGNPKLAHYITSHHGHVPALRCATDAVLAQLRLVALRAQGTPSSALARDATLILYQKALRAVQLALADEQQRLTEETLCATELLAIFELLDENVPSWMHHAGGAAQLIRLRGVHRFRASESGTALFMAHIGTIVMDAFLGNKACFLAEDAWMSLLRSAIRDDPVLAPVQDLSLAIWSDIVTGPAKFKAVTDLVMATPGHTEPDPLARDTIIADLLAGRASLVRWMDCAMSHPAICNDDFEDDDVCGIVFPRLATGTGGNTGGGDPRRNADDHRAHRHLDRVTQLSLWGTNIVCRILKTRLLVAMAPARFRALEAECQYLAARVMRLDAVAAAAAANKSSGVGTGIGDVLKTSFVSQNTWIVRGVLETKDIWSQDGDVRGDGNGDGGVEDKMIEKWKFEAWCRAIGRTLPRTPT